MNEPDKREMFAVLGVACLAAVFVLIVFRIMGVIK